MEERFMIFEEMLKEERAEGFAKGREEGREEGLQEGRSTLKETLLLFLQTFGDIPDEGLGADSGPAGYGSVEELVVSLPVKDVGRVCTEDVRKIYF